MAPKDKDEYQHANENLRFYGNQKFAEITAFVAINIALIGIVFNTPIADQGARVLVLAFFGLMSSICFFVAFLSTTHALFHFMKRAADLEGELNYKLWSTFPTAPSFEIRPHTWASKILYIGMIAFWGAVILWKCCNCCCNKAILE